MNLNPPIPRLERARRQEDGGGGKPDPGAVNRTPIKSRAGALRRERHQADYVILVVVVALSAIGILMGVELILNAANINYIAFARYGGASIDGQIFAIFVIMLAAAEAAVGLAIVLGIYQNFESIDVEATDSLRY